MWTGEWTRHALPHLPHPYLPPHPRSSPLPCQLEHPTTHGGHHLVEHALVGLLSLSHALDEPPTKAKQWGEIPTRGAPYVDILNHTHPNSSTATKFPQETRWAQDPENWQNQQNWQHIEMTTPRLKIPWSRGPTTFWFSVGHSLLKHPLCLWNAKSWENPKIMTILSWEQTLPTAQTSTPQAIGLPCTRITHQQTTYSKPTSHIISYTTHKKH